ncbi:MAG: hypothetical protein CMJ48_04705 [Planctomycetaceae bacterium]|nr:hypothetical protein [Planctomycetaceae bacterium]
MSSNTAEIVPDGAPVENVDIQTENQTDVADVSISISINELILGRPLNQPIYDEKGVLLLAAGAVITADFKRLLKSRKVEEVTVHKSEVEKLTLRGTGNVIEASKISFDSELTKQLDQVIDTGALSVINVGDEVRGSLVQHGRKGYDEEYREELIQKHEEKSEALTGMMQGALRGSKVDGREIAQMTGSFLTDMTADADNLLTLAAEASKQEDLSKHCLQMSLLGMAIGVEMGLDADNVRKLSLAGLIHDWGMALVPDKIRLAERALTNTEFLEIKKHPIYILEMLQNVTGMPSVVPLVCYQVHERINGMGYPRGRSGNAIHQFARILQVADSYVAMTSPRPYRAPLMPYAAMECLVRQAREKIVDANAVRALLQVLSLFPIGSFVTLSDGSVGRVIRRNGELYTEPIVQLMQDAEGNTYAEDDDEAVIDISKHTLAVEQALPAPGSEEIPLTTALFQQSLRK